MEERIAFDSHKHYTLTERLDTGTGEVVQMRIEHSPGVIWRALAGCRRGTAVAVESGGSWCWIVQEIEQAGMRPLLAHPRMAKLMMGMINRTDKLDVRGFGSATEIWMRRTRAVFRNHVV